MVSWHKAVGDLLVVKNVQVAGLPEEMHKAPEEGGRP